MSTAGAENTVGIDTEVCIPQLRAALETALDTVGGTGLDKVLCLLVDSVNALNVALADCKGAKQYAEAAKTSAVSAHDSAVESARDSSAAAIAMVEARRAAAAAAGVTMVLPLQRHDAMPATDEVSADSPDHASTAIRNHGTGMIRLAGDTSGTTCPPFNYMSTNREAAARTQAAEEVTDLLESAHVVATELIALLDEDPLVRYVKGSMRNNLCMHSGLCKSRLCCLPLTVLTL